MKRKPLENHEAKTPPFPKPKGGVEIIQTLPLPWAVSTGQKEWRMINDGLLAHPHTRDSVQLYNIDTEKFKLLELEREYQLIVPLSGNRLAILFSNEIRIYHFTEMDPITHVKTNTYVLSESGVETIKTIKVDPTEKYLVGYLSENNNTTKRFIVIDLEKDKIHRSRFNFEADYSHHYFILDSDQLAILDQEKGLLLFDVNLTDPKKELLSAINAEKSLFRNEQVASITDCSKEMYACMHHAYSLSPTLILWKLDSQLDLEQLYSIKNVNPFIKPCLYRDELYFYDKLKKLMKLNLKTFESENMGIIDGLQNLQISSSGKFMISHHNGVTIYQL